MTAAPDCRTCGACCASLGEESVTIADVSTTDLARMTSRTVRLHVIDDRGHVATRATWKAQRSGPYVGMSACVCSALRGSVLARVSCGIYEQRPTPCHDFEAGSRRCLAARKEAVRIASAPVVRA